MTPVLKLACFGSFAVEANGQPITSFRSQKTQALLAYLAVEGKRPLPRAHLANLLWHGYQPETAQASVRVSLANLRQILAPVDVLHATRQTVQWRGAQPGVWCDALAFAAALPMTDETVSLAQIRTALTLYTGRFLEGFETLDSPPFQAWLAAQRAHYHSLAEQLRQRLPASLTTGVAPLIHNLPRVFTPLIGRDQEVATLRELVLNANYPLITLLGQGGVGKTRLALAVAQSIAEFGLWPAKASRATPPPSALTGGPPGAHFPDGVWFVPLAGLSLTPDLADKLAAAVANTLSFTLSGQTPPIQQLKIHLRDKRLLLIVDNIEHLLPGAADFLLELLQNSPYVSALVTSRHLLNLQAEYPWPLEGLPVPLPEDAAILTPIGLASYSSVALFVERARRVQRTFQLNAANQSDVVAICRFVGGLPLGIELAAAQTKRYTCAQIYQTLQRGYQFLAATVRDLPARQRSIKTVLDDSWRFLTAEAAAVLNRCSVFHGSFSLEAAATVAGAAWPMLVALIDHSLLTQVESEWGEKRFVLHELVRQYAADQLAIDEDAATQVRHRHADYFAKWLAGQLVGLFSTPITHHIIQADLDNIRSAWNWLVEERRFAMIILCLSSLALFHNYAGSYQEMVTLSEFAIARLRLHLRQQPSAEGWRVLGFLLATQAYCSGTLGRLTAAIALAQEARRLGEEMGDEEVQMIANLPLNLIAWVQGHLEVEQAKAAVALAQRYADQPPYWVIFFLGDLGRALMRVGAVAEAITIYEEAIQRAQHRQMRLQEGVLLYQVSQVQARLGDWAHVCQVAQQALVIHQAWGNLTGIMYSMLALVTYANAVGNYGQAVEWTQQVLAQSRARQEHHIEYLALVEQGKAQARLGRVEEAQKSLEAAVVQSEMLANRAYQAWAQLERGRVALEQGAWQTAQATGQASLALTVYPEVAEYRAATQAMLALICFHQHDLADAYAQVEGVLATLATTDFNSHYDVAWVCLTCYQILQAGQDPRAQALLERACAWLQMQAAKISDESLRQSFLANVPENRLLLSLLPAT